LLVKMGMQKVFFRDLGHMDYQEAWDLQEKLLQENVLLKSQVRQSQLAAIGLDQLTTSEVSEQVETKNHLLFVEHSPVYTLGKSGNIENVLLTKDELLHKQIQFYHTNRGGDITFHGPGQVVGYPILDLENFDTDIGKYLRRIEETIILTLADYGIKGERSAGETGVWIDPLIPSKARKICAIGVRCSRWITMHGFALNVNTDLAYFGHIIPCGISNKQVTSLEKEIGSQLNIQEVKEKLISNFQKVFNVEIEKLIANG
jgi:lipoyl(octanoyl) transferase